MDEIHYDTAGPGLGFAANLAIGDPDLRAIHHYIVHYS